MTEQETPRKKPGETLLKIGGIILGVVGALLLIGVMGMVYVEGNLQKPSFCESCHAETYYATWTGEAGIHSLAHKHAEMAVSCQMCHERTMADSVTETVNYVTGNYYYPFEEGSLSMEACFKCHESYEHVISLTTIRRTGEERNPHLGHWGTLECGECHKAHRESVDYCAECHENTTDEPGWVH